MHRVFVCTLLLAFGQWQYALVRGIYLLMGRVSAVSSWLDAFPVSQFTQAYTAHHRQLGRGNYSRKLPFTYTCMYGRDVYAQPRRVVTSYMWL